MIIIYLHQSYTDLANTCGHALFNLVLTSVVVGSSLLTWRLWTFTLRPLLHPNEPRPLPYWIPIIGHGFRFLRDSQALFTAGRVHFANSREPFAVTVFGETIYILTSPRDVSGVFKETTTLSTDQVNINRSFGVSDAGTEQMTRPAFVDAVKGERGGLKDYNYMSEHIRHSQLLPGHQMDILSRDFMQLFEVEMRSGTPEGKYVIGSTGEGGRVVLVKNWAAQSLIRATTHALFGHCLLEMEPQLTDTFLRFDDKSWMVIYNYPEMFAKETYELKEELIQIFMSTNANSFKIAFWMLAHIVHSDGLKAAVVEEASAALPSQDADLDINYLLNQCPLLDSIWNDVLRLTASSSTYRYIVSDTTIRGKTFRAGRKLLIPQRQTLLDESVFGETAATFDAERFMRDRKLANSTSFRPFGGGVSMCSGRHVAKREAFAFVGSVLTRYELKLANPEKGKQRFPRLNVMNPNLGLMGPMPEDDLVLKIKPRH
ncbi:cytochrome P450 [Mytilinidion resinicola]|uniref:Cytochrome P450 n=1 Tax=Mytilinidion resinicola TaxID=574789 RepID=A0A6A6Z4K4_9PEZI|nr:cytochrome P450 [Mytilinidion resinicola]KAF2815105.1 cytochrome P450 [Mytilinidion resinicola]